MNWDFFFDNWGVKTVTANDIAKLAYVPNAEQRQALNAAGFLPAPDSNLPQLISVNVLLEPGIDSVMTSYYLARRSEKAGRAPEARLGRALTGKWLKPGDTLLLANIGRCVYALRTGSLPADNSSAERLASSLPDHVIHTRAAAASGPAPRRIASRTEFLRNPYVVAAALLRARGGCEMPACTRELFTRPDGTPYLEVHHLVPLASDGPDTLSNVAALCPSCHREVHHGAHGARQTAAVLAHVTAVTAAGGQP